jgi:formylglycine-generating enzyme required for sulfatase activity
VVIVGGRRILATHIHDSFSLAVLAVLAASGCLEQRCYEDHDCPTARVCSPTGRCIVPACDTAHPCGPGFECVANTCQPIPAVPITCPADMVVVAGSFCADTYEASRRDATLTSAGFDGSRAMSVAGVLPWMVADNATAESACGAAGKRLCTPEEWRIACKGPDGTAYAYGDTYQPTVCNGIDTFGRQSFVLTPTGAFPGCTNEWGLYDINGNLWEHVAGGSDLSVRGGAFNCIDSAALHRCDYIPGNWAPSARGFRCCLTPIGTPEHGDAGNADARQNGDAATAPEGAEAGGGCVDDAGARARDQAAGADLPGRPDGNEGGAEAAVADAPVADDGPAGSDEAGSVVDLAVDGESRPCPPEMAAVGEICVDRYEASRQDATATGAGSDERVATSRPGVLPWYVNPMSAAALDRFQAACRAAGKRLCTAAEWLESCRGPAQSAYVFGNDWDPAICNSVETYCQTCCDILGLASCPLGDSCGYAATLSSSYTPETCFVTAAYGKDTCHVCYHVMPTGSFLRCTSGNGLFDVNGNVWEVVPSDDSRGYQVRGGAFNCGAPSLRFQCDYNAGWNDLYAGFRCCQDR